jgi:hypothetical protein
MQYVEAEKLNRHKDSVVNNFPHLSSLDATTLQAQFHYNAKTVIKLYTLTIDQGQLHICYGSGILYCLPVTTSQCIKTNNLKSLKESAGNNLPYSSSLDATTLHVQSHYQAKGLKC